MSHITLDQDPRQVRTARRNWYLGTDGLYRPAGRSKIFGKDIKPCTLHELTNRHDHVEIVVQ